MISVSWRCDIEYVVCLFIYTALSGSKQTNKRIIVIPWAVKAVTVGKAPPFPYSPLHKSGLDVYNGEIARFSIVEVGVTAPNTLQAQRLLRG